MDPILQAALDQYEADMKRMNELLDGASKRDKPGLNDDEQKEFETLSSSIEKQDENIARLQAQAERRARADKAAEDLDDEQRNGEPKVRILSEPRTYDEFGQNSYLRDIASIASAHLTGNDSSEARSRMQQHGKEVEIEARTNPRVARQLRGVRSDLQSRAGARGEFEQRVNPNTTAGTGGEFVPPLWLENEYVPLQRPGRTFANRVRNRPLPGGIDVINIPKITVGTQTGVQTANAAPVTSVDFQTSVASAPVNTIAGQEDISMQLLEQSPLSLDGIIFDDLSADYDQRLDYQIIAGTGINGQHKGVLSVPGATTNTSQQQASRITVASTVFFDASTVGTQYRSIVNGVNQIETLRFRSPTGIWVAPRRSNSWSYAADTQGRPLWTAAKYPSFNALGDNENAPTFEGLAGELFGLPVLKDANMPQTMNGTAVTGGTADPIVVLKEDDLILFEGTMRLRALPEILSGTLQIRFQLYCYSAFIPDRIPSAISVLTGNTGLAAPGF